MCFQKINRPQRRGWNEANHLIDTPSKADVGVSAKNKNRKKIAVGSKGRIPLFFSTDDNYLPFLAVTLESLWENSSHEYVYDVYVLHSGVSSDYMERIMRFNEREVFTIRFVDVTNQLKKISKHLHIRDYYTCTTYFRIFIAEMFPQYDKALYLDCDTVILGDVSALHNYELGDNLIAGAPCEGVNSFDVYRKYVEEVDGLNPDYFFNAGVILMNLKAFREENFYQQFADLLQKYKFTFIQDEDYLNVLCQDRVLRLPRAWNKTPVGMDVLPRKDLRIVHYLMTWKPWRYDDVPYAQYFWEYAQKTEFYSYIKGLHDAATQEIVEKDRQQEAALQRMARSEIARIDGYFKSYGKLYGNVEP